MVPTWRGASEMNGDNVFAPLIDIGRKRVRLGLAHLQERGGNALRLEMQRRKVLEVQCSMETV
jgi:hypothetical protein